MRWAALLKGVNLNGRKLPMAVTFNPAASAASAVALPTVNTGRCA